MRRLAAPGSHSTRLIDVWFAELTIEDLDELEQMLAARRQPTTTTTDDGWLDSTRAAKYLGISKASLHKLTAARAIHFEQDAPGCKCWFLRSDLDAYRRGTTDPNAAKTLPRSTNTQLRAA